MPRPTCRATRAARRQAVPHERALGLPPLGRLHRGARHPPHPRRARGREGHVVRPRRRARAVGERRVRRADPAHRARGIRAVPGAGAAAPRCSWSSSATAASPRRGSRRCGRMPRSCASCSTRWSDFMRTLARAGLAHGDLSPYNLLVHDGRVVAIDLPQVVDLVSNPAGLRPAAPRLRERVRLVHAAATRVRRRAAVRRARRGGRVLNATSLRERTSGARSDAGDRVRRPFAARGRRDPRHARAGGRAAPRAASCRGRAA